MPYIVVNIVNTARSTMFLAAGLYFLGVLPFSDVNWSVMLNNAYSAGVLYRPEAFDIYGNDALVLVGESGCEKATLEKTAGGLQKSTGGTVKYRGWGIWEGTSGSPLSDDEARWGLQVVHQNPGSLLNSYQRVRTILE